MEVREWPEGKQLIPWDKPVCILCLRETKLTEEHLIPKSLGGNLVCKFLCKECNSSFGYAVEAKAKTAPTVRLAISHLANDHPELQPLYETMEHRQNHYSDFEGQRLTGKLNRNGTLNEGQLNDGSLIVPEHRSENHMKRILKKEGHSETQVAKALNAWRGAPYGGMVKLSDETTIKKWENISAQPAFHGAPDISSLLPLKIAYEFLVLIAGDPALNNNSQINRIREILHSLDEEAANKFVRRYRLSKYDAFHGICFHGNNPTATFQIRLFGKLACQVTLPNISLKQDTFVYTYHLISKKHTSAFPEHSD